MKPAAIVVAGLGLPVMLIVALIGLVSYEEAEAVCLPGGPALSSIHLRQFAQPGQNVRRMSEDFRRGERVIDAGTRLAAHHLMGLAACGLDEVSVCDTPRMAILTTGSELASSGSELQAGQIRGANWRSTAT